MQTNDPGRIEIGRELKPFHCQNKTCRGVLALTDGSRLVFGDVEITDQRQALYHAACGYTSIWRRIYEENR